MTTTAHIKALALYLGADVEDITEAGYDTYGLLTFEINGEEYAVGTDEEADTACQDYVEQSVWAFKAEFILSECGLPSELTDAIRSFQEAKCESANNALLALVEKCCRVDETEYRTEASGIEMFAKAAIRADGRGHFLSGYDGEENEQEVDGETFYIYRLN